MCVYGVLYGLQTSSRYVTSFSKNIKPSIVVVYLFFPCEGVRFSLGGTTYQNNSIVTLEDIGEGDDALLCLTDFTPCCQTGFTSGNGTLLGNWFFPNGTRVPPSGARWNFLRSRSQSVVRLQRRRGEEEGIYHCEIPDAMNVTQTIYIGVYRRADTQAGE